MASPSTADLVAFLIFVVCIVVYAIEFRMGMKRPVTCKRGLLNVFYGAWVRKAAGSQDPLVAVQTMRNLIMSVTFMSSTMIILMGVLLQSYRIEDFADFSGDGIRQIATMRLLLLFSTIIFVLTMFLLSLRQMVRFSILIGVDVENLKHRCPEGCVHDGTTLLQDVFIKAMNRFTFAMRGLYYLLAAMLWFISPYAFALAGVLITAMLILYQDIRNPGHRKDVV